MKDGENSEKVLGSIGVKRYCCRRMLLAHVEIIDEILQFHEEAARRRAITP